MLAIIYLSVAVTSLPDIRRLRGGDVQLVRKYNEFCELYSIRPHPSVLTALRWDAPHLHATRAAGRPFRDHDLLPLCDLLLLPNAKHIKSLSFKGCRLRSSGAVQVANLLALSPHLEFLDLSGNRLGPDAGFLIAESLLLSVSLKELRLKGCRLRTAGSDAIALALAQEAPYASLPLRQLDLSNNQMGFSSKVGIERVNAQRQRPIRVDLNGNLVLSEALSSVTHGGGAAAAVIGSGVLLRAVIHAPPALRAACLAYSCTLTVCYLSSTLYHMTFALGAVRHVFHLMDQCSIYLLIAGSYTPFMIALFHPHKRIWSIGLLAFLWALCAGGIGLELGFHRARGVEPWIKYTSLTLYVTMGWCAAFPPLLRDLHAAMEPRAMRLLLAGGLAYTFGVPAFLRGRDLDHVIWHVFVLLGSSCHYFALLDVVAATLRATI